jgi:hypothetical protein
VDGVGDDDNDGQDTDSKCGAGGDGNMVTSMRAMMVLTVVTAMATLKVRVRI